MTRPPCTAYVHSITQNGIDQFNSLELIPNRASKFANKQARHNKQVCSQMMHIHLVYRVGIILYEHDYCAHN